MDWWYVFLNTLVYGVLAIVLSWFFAYSKFLNLSIGSILVMLAYLIHDVLVHNLSFRSLALFLILLWLYYFTTWVLWRAFTHDTQRDHAWLIITLALGWLLENLINYFYGPSSVSLSYVSFTPWMTWIILAALLVFFYYLFAYSIIGTVFKGLFERSSVIRSIWIRSIRLLQSYSSLSLLLIAGVSFILLNQSSIRSSDNLFYLIKGVGIMILVGVSKQEYMIVGAFLYVLLEYFLFVIWGLPLSYKESLVLLLILVVLVMKPEWLFNLWKRNV